MSADENNQDAEQEVTHVEEMPLEGGSKLVDQDEAADGAETVLPDGEHQPVKTEGFAHQLALSEHMNDPAFQSPTESHDEAVEREDQNDRLLPGTKAFHEAQQTNALATGAQQAQGSETTGEDEEAQHAGERRRWEALDMRKHALATAVQMAGQKPHMLEAHVVDAARSFLAFLQEKDDAPAESEKSREPAEV